MPIALLMKAPATPTGSRPPTKRLRAASPSTRRLCSAPPGWCKRHFGRSTGETLCILSLIGLIAIASNTALTHLSSSRALTVSGNKIARMLKAARENAISKQVLTALIVLAEQGSEGKFRTFTIAERTENGTWRQITNWEPLAAGVTLEVDPRHCTLINQSLPLPGYVADEIAYCDRPLTTEQFASLVFHPDGGLGSSHGTAQIRLVERTNPETAEDYTLKSRGAAPAPCYDIAIAVSTGILKVQHR